MKVKYQMLQEIREQPDVIAQMVKNHIDRETGGVEFREMADKEALLKGCKRYIFLGNGSSSHAALFGNYVFEEITGLPAEYELADEFISRKKIVEENTGVVVLSQSGETGDILEAVKQVKKNKAVVIGITNTAGSSLAKAADLAIVTPAGKELAVAATKSFSAQLAMLVLLALHIDRVNHTESALNHELIGELEHLPDKIMKILDHEKAIEELAGHLYREDKFIILGRHYQYPIAREGAQKLKETTYIETEALESEEFRHGPIAVIDRNFPVLLLATHDHNKEYTANIKVAEEIVNARGRVYPISDKAVDVPGVKPTLVVPPPMKL